MHNYEPQNFQTYYCAVFVDSLVRHGLRHVVISPGSRSTPLAIAFAAHPQVKKHIVIDERSAGFIALGIAQYSGFPAALVCTSGTAVANYLPAVSESRMSGIPMIVLSADRDFDEHNTGANQWIDQTNIFGNKAIFHANANVDMNRLVTLDRLRLLADQTWLHAIDKKGCAHINFPFHKPLEPDTSFVESLTDLYNSPEFELLSNQAVNSDYFELDRSLLNKLSEAKRPIIVCGAGQQSNNLSSLIQQFTRLGIPVLYEAASTPILPHDSEFVYGANSYLRNEENCHVLRPDLIIRFGSEPIGKGILNYLKIHRDVDTIHFTDLVNWSNSTFSNTTIFKCTSNSTCMNLPQTTDGYVEWKHLLRKFSSDYLTSLSKIESVESLRDGDVYIHLKEHISANDLVMISNSFSARDLDLFGSPYLTKNQIYSNRGVSGIDGITSTAIGIAKATDRRVTLIIGDLAWMHDMNAMITMRNDDSIRVRVIVLNNNGGNIFRMLPISGSNYYQTYFETPQYLNISNITHSMGIESYSVRSTKELSEALSTSESSRLVVIECHTDAELSMGLRKLIWK